MKNENLYLKFVVKYTDDELLSAIEDPSGLEKDVYNAILSVSLDRDLISAEQYDQLFDTENSVKFEDIEEEEIQVNTHDFWKCPKCGQTIEMNFEACWNCQNNKPEKIEHPTKEKIREYQSYEKPFNFIKAGLSLIGLGVLILILSTIMTMPDFFGFHFLPLGRFLTGFVFIILGFAFIIIGVFRKSED